tara:strand:+ start:1105 stop:1431 length:327 start_codon:yes stop_codon:yes gene_type:complete
MMLFISITAVRIISSIIFSVSIMSGLKYLIVKVKRKTIQNINIFLIIEIEKISKKVSLEIIKCVVDNINKSKYEDIHRYCNGINLIKKIENIVPIKINKINPKNKSGT